MSDFFRHFPTIPYNGHYLKNLFVRLRLHEALSKDNLGLLPYQVSEGERADTVAHNYYGDSNLDWLIFLANQYLDPQFDWPLDSKTLDSLIISKYGSIQESQERILFYRTEWASDETVLSPEQYVVLADNVKKFWAPNIGVGRTPIFYERKKQDLEISTNQIIELGVDVGNIFSKGDRVSSNSVNAEVELVSENVVTVKHVEGVFEVSEILSNPDDEEATIESINIINNSIPGNEVQFWSAVTAYEFEQERNEERKQIVLVEKSFAPGIVSLVKGLVRG